MAKKHIGVSRHKKTGQWQAEIRMWGKVNHIGYFATEAEAIKAYEAVAQYLNT